MPKCAIVFIIRSIPLSYSFKPDQLLRLRIAFVVIALLVLAACHSKTESKHYVLTGKIISIDKNSQSMLIDGDEIKGFMEAMAMTYTVKNTKEMDGLNPGDVIVADLMQQGDSYWIENVRVTQKAGSPTGPTKTDFHMPSPGEAVPDFKLVNQSNRQVSLGQYRGKTLIVTFIYTRCPYPDFCPRVMGQFADLNKQLAADPKLYAKTHLLSISFDPAYDTPKVLTDYGHQWAGKQPDIFSHWEFAAAPAADVAQIAQFFGLTVIPEKDNIITHSLSTAVIGPDGKIVRWYHGSDWQAADLVKDAAAASS